MKTRVNNFLSVVDPLDLIVFKGGGYMSSAIIKFQNSEFEISHVGVAITADTCPWITGLDKNQLYVWESTIGSTHHDSKSIYPSGQNIFGVQIRPLSNAIYSYLGDTDTRVGVCKLKNNPWKSSPTDRLFVIEQLYQVYKSHGTAKFDTNIYEIAAMVFPAFKPLRDLSHKLLGNDQFTCSEFVALIYKQLNMLSRDTIAYEIMPADLAGNATLFGRVIWV
jgi:hypothetical protein